MKSSSDSLNFENLNMMLMKIKHSDQDKANAVTLVFLDKFSYMFALLHHVMASPSIPFSQLVYPTGL